MSSCITLYPVLQSYYRSLQQVLTPPNKGTSVGKYFYLHTTYLPTKYFFLYSFFRFFSRSCRSVTKISRQLISSFYISLFSQPLLRIHPIVGIIIGFHSLFLFSLHSKVSPPSLPFL
ncbi:hypothetical protein F4775DRAFT_44839 [Biscogniauxia sp. FL1348]|nr:hypothetical protein F4775DRAFT_44839 [Biscogniauxia sp. FL1348]